MQRYSAIYKLMGNRFTFTVVAPSQQWADAWIELARHEVARIEVLLTTYSETSETALVNRNASIAPVQVSCELLDLVERSLKISQLTQGAFDITYGGIDKRLWNFDTTLTALPSAKVAAQSVRLIDYRNIIIDRTNQTLFLKEKGMRIGFGGIGKGYAADRARALLMSEGAPGGIINASGDMCVWGSPPEGNGWRIGISAPDAPDKPFSHLNLTDQAVATSGNYEKFVVIDGKHYSHTIDPRTGLPVSGIKSVTVVAPTAELADAMTTPLWVMGVEQGMALMNKLKGMACVMIDEQNRIYTSGNIK